MIRQKRGNERALTTAIPGVQKKKITEELVIKMGLAHEGFILTCCSGGKSLSRTIVEVIVI